jgi:hypothetical protein
VLRRAAIVDPRLAVKIVSSRELRYSHAAHEALDRPHHVRAASGLAAVGGRLVVVQDDAAFLAVVAGDSVTAVPLPRGAGGRRRFEDALGNRLEKVDLESCVAIDDELWAFGSGSLPTREKLCRLRDGVPRLTDAAPLFARLREEVGGAVNIEGATRVDGELWLFHRGNTGGGDTPRIVRLPLQALRRWLDGAGPLPEVAGSIGFDLGAIAGAPLGFTDAVAAEGRVFYLATAEASEDAIADGDVHGSHLGVISSQSVRAAPLPVHGAKAEGLAFADGRVWVVLDPDDTERPATLLELALVGPWLA